MFEIQEKKEERKIIATNKLKAGTVLCTFAGKLIDYDQTLRLEEESFALQIQKDTYMYLDEPYRYFNHCCEPNCGLTPDYKLITLQDVAKLEELRYDYSTTMLEHHWTMKCECGKPTCRKVVTDFDKLPKALQEKYLNLNIVQEFIVKQITKKQ